MFRIISTALYILYSSASLADDSFFISGKIGKAIPDKYTETNLGAVEFDFDNGIDYSLSIGKNFNRYGLEFEYSKRTLDANSRRIISSNSTENLNGKQIQEDAFINAYYYPLLKNTYSLYFGIGLGLTVIKWRNIESDIFTGSINSVDYVHSYKGIFGGTIKLTDNVDFQTSVEYLIIDDINLQASDGSSGEMNNQDIQKINIGIKYKF